MRPTEFRAKLRAAGPWEEHPFTGAIRNAARDCPISAVFRTKFGYTILAVDAGVPSEAVSNIMYAADTRLASRRPLLREWCGIGEGA